MCGICGKLSFSGRPIEENLIRTMCKTISYRGPDDEGVWCMTKPEGGSIGLGHRRLSIIDLSEAGKQPIANEDKSLWLVFNGEIYNFTELRKKLEKSGHRFTSNTDSEVLLHQYEEDGITSVEKFNGMFAFSLWDNHRNRLLLCRDRIGIKPLYYYWDGKDLVFASEIKAILADPSVKREISFEALGLYLMSGYIPAPWTIFEKIYKLRPGHCLIAENGTIRLEKYWDLQSGDVAEGISFEDQKHRLFELMSASVRSHLVSDVPLGAFLSGGIDSSIVVGLMAQNMSQPVRTFSIGYKDLPLYDETDYAKEVASFHGTDHHEFKVSCRDTIDIVPAVLDSLDEPFSDSSVFPTYLVSQKTRKEVTVALAGDGADELFAGYRRYTGEYWYRYYSSLPKFLRSSVLEPAADILPDSRDGHLTERLRRVKKFIQGAEGPLQHRIEAWRKIFTEEGCRDMIRPDIFGKFRLETFSENIAGYLEEFAGDPINKMLYLDLKDSLPDDMLNKVDRMSMLNSLEVRVPFLDHSVVEFAFRLPGQTKLHRGRRKYILLETFKSLLPKRIHNRPKWGFEVPISAWLKDELRFLIDDYLSERTIEDQGIFNYASIQKLKDSYFQNKSDTSWQLWNLIILSYWYKRYVG
ncbi:MAG: asparagine synthase (glutamine-hydrolyzing) [Desulfobacteraceae bacterium]|nr:MAG: asparagine synthase (glutamine-hydrolyzing) [Desulfobacteraceae bacterium]